MLKLFSTAMLALGIFVLIYSVIFLTANPAAPSFERDNEIDKLMTSVASTIDQYHQEHGKYPSALEFISIRGDLSQYGEDGENLTYYNGNISDPEVIQNFGEPNNPTYTLRVWRGEWFEYYAGWLGRSTLPKTLSEYYYVGSKIGDFLVFAVMGGLLILGSFLIKTYALKVAEH